MRLVYARNCDMYYDDLNEQIVFSKRGKYFVLKASKDVLRQMKEIICDFETVKDLEPVVENLPEQKKKSYLSYLKFMWNKNILVEHHFQEGKLSESMQDYLTANHNASKELIQFWEEGSICAEELPQEIIKELNRYGIQVNQDSIESIEPDKCLMIGNYSKDECQKLLLEGKKVLLYREQDGNVYLMFLNRFEEMNYQRFENFTWNTKQTFYGRNLVVAFQIISHCSNSMMNPEKQSFVCISGDGSLHQYDIGKLCEESATYFNRNTIPDVSLDQFVTMTEKMNQTVPFLIKGCNEHNRKDCQSPICNFELDFGEDFQNEVYVAYHESYKKAVKQAFEQGFEKVLNQDKKHNFRVATSLLEYEIKGYISLLEKTSELHMLVVTDDEILSRLKFLETIEKQVYQFYYAPTQVEGIGKVILCDKSQRVVGESPVGYQVKEQMLEVLYGVIGMNQTGKTPERKALIDLGYFIEKGKLTQWKEASKEETREKLVEHFMKQEKIIDEKVWAYQAQLAEYGLHVGEYYFVR